MTAAEICYNMHTSLFHACALLFDLVKEDIIRVAGEAPEPTPEVSADLSALKLPVPELLKLARAEIKENNAENALAIIHSALEQEAKNAEAHRLREEAEKKFVAQIFQGGLSPRATPRILVSPEQLEHEKQHATNEHPNTYIACQHRTTAALAMASLWRGSNGRFVTRVLPCSTGTSTPPTKAAASSR